MAHVRRWGSAHSLRRDRRPRDAPSHEEIIGAARYDRVRPQVAEMAGVVADHWQGCGLGPFLCCGLPYTLMQLDDDTLVASVDITQLDCLGVVDRE